MAYENRSNQSWKKLLEDEVALSGELLHDKTAAWKELHHRLHQQPRRKKIAGYWVAAASLLLMLTIPFTFLQNNKTSVVKNAAPKKEIPVLFKQPPAAKRATAILRAKVIGHTTKKEAIKNRIKDSSHSVAVSNKPDLEIKTMEENRENNLILPPVVDSSSATKVEAAQLKKPLKVVHVNELGDPVMESPAWAHNTGQHSFEIQIGKEEMVANTAVSFNKPRFAVIKIKTSPTN